MTEKEAAWLDRASIETAITGRRAIRAFLPRPVGQERVLRILDIAARAPSGSNLQPWRVYALAGPAKQAFEADIVAASLNGEGRDQAEYKYYPGTFFEPYLSRRRKIGWDLYGLLGIEKGDKSAMLLQHTKNFQFFGAPVGLLFTINRRLETGSWLDYGMFLQNIMIAARAQGLETCPQAAFADFHSIIRNHFGLMLEEIVVCGMSLGYPDPAAVENQLVTERVPARDFASFHGFPCGAEP